MTIKDRLAKAIPVNVCIFQNILNGLDKEDREAIDNAVMNNISFNAIWMALKDEGHRLGYSAITRHYTKVCVCHTREAASE